MGKPEPTLNYCPRKRLVCSQHSSQCRSSVDKYCELNRSDYKGERIVCWTLGLRARGYTFDRSNQKNQGSS